MSLMQISEGDIPGQVSDDIRPELIFEAQACKFVLELLGTCLVLVRLLGLHCSNTKCPVSAHSAMETITCGTDLHRKASRDAGLRECRLCPGRWPASGNTVCTGLLAFLLGFIPCDNCIGLDRLPCIIRAVLLLIEAHEVPAAKNLAC